MVAVLIRKLFPQRLYCGTTCHVLVPCVISRFLGSFEDRPGLQEHVAQFSVAPQSLQLPTASTRVRVKSKGAAQGFGRSISALAPGALAKLRRPHKPGPANSQAGRYVIVLARHTKADPSVVSSSIDACPFFSKGTWHAVRVHHRGRVLFAPESACERMGSFMHMIWNGQGRWRVAL